MVTDVAAAEVCGWRGRCTAQALSVVVVPGEAGSRDAARAILPWVVLKFGGTSVSSLANWRNILGVVRARRAEGARVLVVHSALTGVTDQLERLLSIAPRGEEEPVLAALEERHLTLARELDVDAGAELRQRFAELRQIAAGVRLVGEVSDRVRAKVMGAGELMATLLGAGFLRVCGERADWVDARTMLTAEGRRGGAGSGIGHSASVLSATCEFAPDEALRMRLAALAPVVVTQGFIAGDAQGNTVLLGRGGSDTSAAYLAAKLSASRLEIWTDVPGLFSANPRAIPAARLLRALHYDEAQEIASSGAKVLHPRCILPVRVSGIPVHVYDTRHPELEGTVISDSPGEGGAQVKAVCLRKGITLVSMESPGMWHEVGFLADAFGVCKRHGLSVDLVSTSETNVTVSLDPAANVIEAGRLDEFVAELSRLCGVRVIGPCASVSLLGRNIRGILHQLGDAFALFEEQKVHLVSQAANDLNFTFVVDEEQGDRLARQLHELLIRPVRGDRVLGPTWEELFAARTAPVVVLPEAAAAAVWWRRKADALLEALGAREAAFIYSRDAVRAQVHALRDMRSLSRVLYAMKANPHPEMLAVVHREGFGIECVSRGEIERAFGAIPMLNPAHVLYTPNFAARKEYEWAYSCGVRVTVDNAYVLETWPTVFRGREAFVRVDTGFGRGHHQHVRTAGAESKFGVPVEEMGRLAEVARQLGLRICGLHAHIGSGIFDVGSWAQTAEVLAELAASLLPDVRVLDVGGGLGVPERSEEPGVDLGQLDDALVGVRSRYPQFELWMEPGRFVVAGAGVLLARVTQTKMKGERKWVGVATGVNSLIRPALYGAHHEIVNLSRLDEPATEVVDVVGPICESGDVLGHDRLLPVTRESDVLLIANAGAYGRAMSSHYNLRAPAEEMWI